MSSDSSTSPAANNASTALIGIPTFRRPRDLARLLASLPGAINEALREGLISSAEVLVVDNDPDGSARSVVEAAPLTPRYVVEPRPGVVAVRNRILDESSPHRWLVFIDDDESPAADAWLAELLRARAQNDAHAVSGPVRTVVEGELDSWIRAGGYFERAHRASLRTGDPIDRAATNNLLLDLAFVRSHQLRFDEAFGRSGGEDSMFTSQLHQRGARMVWSADAVVLDHLPPERSTRKHALRRTRGMASAGVRVALALSATTARRATVRARAAVIGAGRCAVGAGAVVAGTIFRFERFDAVGRRELMRGLGGIEGAAGRFQAHYGDR